MKYMTDEEFDQIFHEIVVNKPICFDKMAEVVDRMMRPVVYNWCNSDPVLAGKQYENDVMQEVHIRLLKKSVTGFFMRNDEPNYDPAGFKNWIFTVAVNVKNDFAKKVRRNRYYEVKGLDDIDEPSTEDTLLVTDEMLARLNGAFRIVLQSDSKVYKILTWMAQMLMILKMGISKIESNSLLIHQFEFNTLDAMLDTIVDLSESISWLQLDEEIMNELRERLDEPCEDGVRLGDKKYRSFFMKKGPKASISDWVNRMNNYIMKEEDKEEERKNGTFRN